jgi:hypothetical protein
MPSISTLIWMGLLAFACNDGEELLTVEAWIRKNRERYRMAPEALMLNLNKPITAQFAVAVAVVGSVVLTATLVGAREFAETGRLHGLFVAVLAVLFLDGIKHILFAIYLRQYASGVLSAALVQVPYTVYAFHRFLVAGLLTWSEILRDGVIGLVLVFPVLMLGFALGRWVIPERRATASR